VSYPTKLLAPGERIAFELKPHWRALIGPVLVLVIEVFIGTWLYFSVANWSIGSWSLAWLQWPILIILIGVAIWRVALPFARWITTQYVFTSRRIIVRRGLVTKQGRDMPLNKVNNVSFSVSVLGRILNYGALEVESASDDGDLYIDDVPDVEEIQRQVYELHELDDSRRRTGNDGDDPLPPMN
jgi:uncharacterized membrane protein YdbT with pleckstrin-like domain